MFSRCALDSRRMLAVLDESFAEITSTAGSWSTEDGWDREAFEAASSATRSASRAVEDFRLLEVRVGKYVREIDGTASHRKSRGVAELRDALRALMAAMGLRPRDATTVPIEARHSIAPLDFSILPECLVEIVARWSFARAEMLESVDSMEAIFRMAWRRHLAGPRPSESEI